MASISPRSHRRTSVATWSLRLRPVCRRLPASPTSCVRRASMFRCTSSRSSFHSNWPASISGRIWRHAALDGGMVVRADDALRGQHFGMRQAARDVGLPQALVEEHAGGVALDEVAHGLGKQRRPRLRLGVELVVGRRGGLAGGHGGGQ